MSDMESDDYDQSQKCASEQKYWKDFILSLETLPELWDVSSKSYSNKMKRAAGYQKLLTIMKNIKPDCQVNDVKKKINSLRSNYRKELKKIKASKVSGAGADEIYYPRSWKFHALHFLKRNEQPVGVKNLRHESETGVSQDSGETGDVDVSDISFSSLNEPPPPQRAKKSGPINKQNELIEKACSLLAEKPDSGSTKINATAIYWTEKLDKLNSTQRSIAEKAVNDILFEAELGNLSRDSVKINISPNSCNTELSLAPSPQHIEYQQFNGDSVQYNASANKQNTELSLDQSPEPNNYQELPTETNFYLAPQKVNIIRIQKPLRIFVPPPTPSPDSNFPTAQPGSYMSPCNLSPQLPASGQAKFVYQPEIGATQETENAEEYSIRSLFSSFDTN